MYYNTNKSSFKGWGKGLKIFYAVQATGNGHIARAMELMPYLQQYGEVDVFLSGGNSNLSLDIPVKYRSKGLSLFYGNSGGLNYWKMWKELNLKRVWSEAKNLPVHQYDMVINDFECITSLACKLKKIKSLNFGHQASFQSAHTPRPEKRDFAGEIILKKYASADDYIGLHFERFDSFIYPPIIKENILIADPIDNGHVTVYLSHYADEAVANQLRKVKEVRFEVFSKQVKHTVVDGNITFKPVGNKAFNDSMISSKGVITGAGFETPAEALYMGKRLMCLPIKGQYEQWCNAAALRNFAVPVIKTIDDFFPNIVEGWLNSPQPEKLTLSHSTYDIVQVAIEKARQLKTGTTDWQMSDLTEDEGSLALF